MRPYFVIAYSPPRAPPHQVRRCARYYRMPEFVIEHDREPKSAFNSCSWNDKGSCKCGATLCRAPQCLLENTDAISCLRKESPARLCELSFTTCHYQERQPAGPHHPAVVRRHPTVDLRPGSRAVRQPTSVLLALSCPGGTWISRAMIPSGQNLEADGLKLSQHAASVAAYVLLFGPQLNASSGSGRFR